MAWQKARTALVVVVATIAGACSSAQTGDAPASETDIATASGVLAQAFEASAARADVPRDLLVAIAKVEDGLAWPRLRDDVDEDNDVPAAGPLQLRRGKLDTLARGAALVSATEADLRRDSDLALTAGALVLAELGADTGADRHDLASWRRAIEEMSGFADEAHRESYSHQVFATLARGGRFPARDGETLVLAPHDLPPSLTIDVSSKLRLLANAEYPDTEWIPTSCTNKCTPGRGTAKVELVIVHSTEGGWNASVATLQNDPNKSAHYIIGTDGRLGQFITEDTTGWHAGNFHYNQRGIGLEHVGYASQPFAEAQYEASAKLTAHLTTKYKIPRDRAHVIGHDQIPNGRRIEASSAPCMDSPKACQSSILYGGASAHHDPGVWEWPTFMARFGGESKCNDATRLWNCSNDKTRAFRCKDDTVEVETCDGALGCEVKADGEDDVCDVKPKVTPPVPEPSDPPPPATSDPPETTGAAISVPSADAEPPAASDSGCAVAGRAPSRFQAPGPLGLPLFGLFAALAGIASAVRRRRR
jgi:N-acetyl-anhydromuramyl-L-alanine amidase AmpD